MGYVNVILNCAGIFIGLAILLQLRKLNRYLGWWERNFHADEINHPVEADDNERRRTITDAR